jgi:hypothetical protein
MALLVVYRIMSVIICLGSLYSSNFEMLSLNLIDDELFLKSSAACLCISVKTKAFVSAECSWCRVQGDSEHLVAAWFYASTLRGVALLSC